MKLPRYDKRGLNLLLYSPVLENKRSPYRLCSIL